MKTHGVIATDDGHCMLVSLCRTGSEWRLGAIQKWQCGNALRSALLLNRGVYFGVPTHWISSHSAIDRSEFVAAKTTSPFIQLTRPATHDVYAEALAHNLCGIVPDDLFLTTLPLTFGNPEIHSFATICRSNGCFKIGITIDKELVAVFPMAPDNPDLLSGHIARIRHYFTSMHPEKAFPADLYLIGVQNEFDKNEFCVHELKLPGEKSPWAVEQVLKASGVALASTIEKNSIQFSGETPAARFRTARTAIYAISILLLAGTILATAGYAASHAWYSYQTSREQTRYQQTITDSKDLQKLLEDNKTLARKIERMRGKLSNQTRWTEFLQKLGEIKPGGLFFDRLGSEPDKKSPNSVRLAMTGWCGDESLVTTLMDKLQTTEYISAVQLSGLSRDEGKKGICRFRIYCTIRQ
jgi:hypothetical protein